MFFILYFRNEQRNTGLVKGTKYVFRATRKLLFNLWNGQTNPSWLRDGVTSESQWTVRQAGISPIFL
jgi:hypothetical protein